MTSTGVSAPPRASILRWFARRRALRRYLTILPRKLASDYGHRGPFTAAQVQRAIERHRLSRAYAAYALVIFCSEDELTGLRRSGRLVFDDEALRQEVQATYFGNGPVLDGAYRIAEQHAAWGETHAGHGDVGHHGGDAGGGHH